MKLKPVLRAVICAILLVATQAPVLAGSYTFGPDAIKSPKHTGDKEVKYGTVSENETWSGKVYIIGDVTIPKGVTVTVLPGTVLEFSDYDILASGEDKALAEIIVHGTFDAKSEPGNPIYVTSIQGKTTWKHFEADKKTQVISFSPYEINTKILRDEFRSFKTQYIVLWSIIYAIWVLR